MSHLRCLSFPALADRTAPPCPGAEGTAHAWVDGELAPADRQAFAGHLRTCPPCRARVADLARLLAAVRRTGQGVRAPARLRTLVRDLAAGTGATVTSPAD